jgi:hypothetical protein
MLYDRIGVGIPFIAGGILGILVALLALTLLPTPNRTKTSTSTFEDVKTPSVVSELSQVHVSTKK